MANSLFKYHVYALVWPHCTLKNEHIAAVSRNVCGAVEAAEEQAGQ